jgi:CheY-like chemotaxis protein
MKSVNHHIEPNLLVVDNDPTNRMVVRLLMTRRGFHVTEASDAEEATTKVSERLFFAVLVDLSTPDLDGLEVTKLIRERCGSNGQVPIIALSAQSIKDNLDLYKSVGMAGQIGKPFDPVEACTLLSLLCVTGQHH